MSEEQKNPCKHPTCSCQASEGSKYCGEYCEDAEKSGVLEIGCGCEHGPCR